MDECMYPQVLKALLIGLFPWVCLADCGDPATAIEDIQGQGAESPMIGRAVTVEATVSAVFQGSGELDGFYIQQPDKDQQASHGLFVYTGIDVRAGERVRLRGQVTEYYGLTELTKVRLLGRCGNEALPNAIALPPSLSLTDREALEGVLVRTAPLNITENHQLVRYGQLQLGTDFLGSPAEQRWLVDDPSSQVSPSSISYLSEVSSRTQLHLGNEVAPFHSIVTFSFGEYRLIPTKPLSITTPDFALPAKGDTAVRVAGVNVNNLFNGNGRGDGFNVGRGPENQKQYKDKLTRLSQALLQLQADVLVLNEVENDGFNDTSTVADLIESLNQQTGSDRMDAVSFSAEQTGGSAIQNVILFKARTVVPVAEPKSILATSQWRDRWHRPFLQQAFEFVGNGERFVVVAAHLKSKGSGCPGDTPSAVEREGACSAERVDAIAQLLDWLPNQEQRPVLLVGDLNAYPNERPIKLLERAGWESLVDMTDRYSYVFDGTPGILDYVIGNALTRGQVIASGYWPINSGAVQGSSLPRSLNRLTMPPFYAFSDHDPVFADLTF